MRIREGVFCLISVLLIVSCSMHMKLHRAIDAHIEEECELILNINQEKMKESKSIKLDSVVVDEEKNIEASTTLTEVELIDDSPFSAVKVVDKWFLALGKYRLTDLYDDKQTVLDSVNDTSWDRLLAVMHAVAMEVVDEGKQADE